jgi:hypothetical protein
MINKKWLTFLFLATILCCLIWHFNQKPPLIDDWPSEYLVTTSSTVDGDLLMVKNVRNFRYDQEGIVTSINYYDKTYNLSDLVKVWYIYEPFGYAAHSLLSFEFKNNIFLTISIEAKTNKKQTYNAFAGVFRTYPLMYVVADENDAIILRANVRKNQVILYPTTFSPENTRDLLLEMLGEVNRLNDNPKWYNTITANCTSLIVDHINKVSSSKIPYSWKLVFAGYADEVFYDAGLLDTNLSLEEAKKQYNVTELSKNAGDVSDYSILIRKNIQK